MKKSTYTLFVITFIFLVAHPLTAEQSERRMENRFQIAAFPFYRSYVSFAYNWETNLTFGVTGFRGGRIDAPEIVPNQFDDCWTPGIYVSYCEKSTSYQPTGHLFAQYFPFEFPVFFSFMAGRSGGMQLGYTELVSLIPSGLAVSSQAPVVYTVTEEAYYYAGLSTGVRWVFDNGLLLGGEAVWRATEAHGARVYMKHDLRAMLPDWNALSPMDIWYQERLLESTYSPARYKLNLLVYAGFSF